MKNWKDILSNICALLIVITGALVTAIQTGVITFLPAWVQGVCVLVGIIAAAVVAWLTGKNPNLTSKTPLQVEKSNEGK